MPQERDNPYPFFTPEELAALRETTSREQLAARCVATQKFGKSIPKASFMRGACDHSAMMQGVLALTTATYKLLDQIDRVPPESVPSFIREAYDEVKAMMEDPG